MKSERNCIFRCAIFFAIINIINCVNSNLDSVSEILKFWKEQEDLLKLGTKKDIVIFLGDTGSGKSALISLLTGVELESVETNTGSGAFNIVDNNGRVTRNSTVISQTLVPELIMDRESDVAYFDCPGFKDTRGAKYDITITYLIRKLLEFADSVKLVFVINQSSVTMGGHRHGILELAKHANHLIKNIEKFSDAIGLVVTKVENRRIPAHDGKFTIVDDKKTIEGIHKFLEQAKMDLKGLNEKADTPPYDRQINEMGIKFIDILLRKGVNGQSRIGIFRKPLKAGSISDMPLLQSERDAIKRQINQNLKFIDRADGDFGYSLSDESKIRATELINEIQIRLLVDISIIGDKTVSHHTQQGIEFFDLDLLREQASSIHKALLQSFDEDPYVFLKKFLETVKVQNVAGTMKTTENIEKHIKHLEFLTKLTERTTFNPQQIADGLITAIHNVGRLQNWYDFLIDLYERISEMNLRAKRLSYEHIQNDAKDLMEKCSNVEETKRTNLNEIGLKKFLDGIDIKMNFDMEKMPINAFQLNALKAVLNAAINNNVTCSSDGSTITGFNVKMSDIIEMKCWHISSTIEIFALDKILFDVDFKRTHDENPKQLSIIAPVWKILGNREINLNGKHGINMPFSAEDGYSSDIHGKNGAPGRPGSSAASFFGIGNEFVGDLMLSLQAIGGNGGSGQDGGKGFRGIKEKPFSLNRWDYAVAICGSLAAGALTVSTGGASVALTVPILNTLAGGLTTLALDTVYKYKYPETEKIIGKNGIGGSPGLAGSHGDIEIISFGTSPQFAMNSLDGAMGKRGNDGDGQDGSPSYQNKYSISATNITAQQMAQTMQKYMEFAEIEMANHVRQIKLKEFIGKMPPNERVEEQHGIIHDEM